MPAQPQFQAFGLNNFLLAEPEPSLQLSRGDVDTLDESYQSDSEREFEEGQVHPTRPGMIIDLIRTRIEVPNESYVHAITALGDSSPDARRATKHISRSDKRTLDIGWDEFGEEA